jgi:hypothetical protein
MVSKIIANVLAADYIDGVTRPSPGNGPAFVTLMYLLQPDESVHSK